MAIFSAGLGHAGPIRSFEFAVVVQSVPALGVGYPMPGSLFRGRFAYDLAAAPFPNDPRAYINPVTVFEIDGLVTSLTSGSTISINNNDGIPPFDQFTLGAQVTGPDAGNASLLNVLLRLRDEGASPDAFDGTALPDTLQLDWFNSAFLEIGYGRDGTQGGFVRARFTELGPARELPGPGVLPLALLALTVMWALRRLSDPLLSSQA